VCECSQKGQGYIGLERDRKEGGAGGVGESGREGVFFKVTEREREKTTDRKSVCATEKERVEKKKGGRKKTWTGTERKRDNLTKIWTHTHKHTHIHTHAGTHQHTRTRTRTCTHTHTHTLSLTYAQTHTHTTYR